MWDTLTAPTAVTGQSRGVQRRARQVWVQIQSSQVGDGAAASTGGSLFTLEPPESVDHWRRWQVLPYPTHILVIFQAVVRGNGGGGIARIVCRSDRLKIHSFQNYRERPELLKVQTAGRRYEQDPPSVAVTELNERAREDRWSQMKKKEEDVFG